MRTVKRIIKIHKIEGYKISTLFSTGESRLVNFEKLFAQWNIKQDDPEFPLKDSLQEFQKVEVIDGTFVWKNIELKSTDEYGNPVIHFYDIDPIVIYEVSEVEMPKKVAQRQRIKQSKKELISL